MLLFFLANTINVASEFDWKDPFDYKSELTTEEFESIARRIQIIDRKKEATQAWGYVIPQRPMIRSPYQ